MALDPLYRRVLAATVTTALAVATTTVLPPLVAGAAAPAPAPLGAVVAPPDSAFAAPADAKYVAPGGDDLADGSPAAPWRTIGHAVGAALAGSTIVVRGGTYREPLVTVSRPLTIQAAPHEVVWIDGTSPVGGFVASGSGWSAPWHSPLCGSCVPQALIDPQYPAARSPEQVFVDGVAQREVTAATAVVSGTFFYDRAAQRFVLGADPSGRDVQAVARTQALSVTSRGAGTVVRGLGFRRFGPSLAMAPPGMVTIDAGNVVLDSDAFVESSGRAVSFFADHDSMVNSIVAHNGLNGVHAHQADYLVLLHNRVTDSNSQHLSIAPSPQATIAAVKVTTSKGDVVSGNVIDGNDSNGIWFDISSYQTTVVGNTVVGNAGQGIMYEVSGTGVIAGNTSVVNGRDGIRVSGSTNVAVWHNTAVGNGWSQLGVYDDPRTTANAAWNAVGITWDTHNVSAFANVLVGGPYSTRPIFASQDTGGRILTSYWMLLTTLV